MHYIVQSGGSTMHVEAGAEATPLEIAMLALERNSQRSLGLLIEVSGGQYVGDNTSYVLSTNVCARLGRLSA